MSSEKCKLKQERYNYTPIRMAKVQNTDITNAGEDVKQQELSIIVGGDEK